MVDVERIGVSELSPGLVNGPSGQPTEPTVNIVFVHGLRGHPRHTWECDPQPDVTKSNKTPDKSSTSKRRSFFHGLTKKSSSTANKTSTGERTGDGPEQPPPSATKRVFWPEDLLAPALPSARILTYGYNADVISGLFEGNNRNSIIQHGNDLMVRLEREVSNGKPVIFVVHSLGGLVVKRAIQQCKASLDDRYNDLFRRVNTILFCGTPHRGSGVAPWGVLASNLAAVALKDTNKGLLSDLQVDSQILDLIQDDFLKLLHGDTIRIHSFQEGRGMSGIKPFGNKVVDDFSSKLGYGKEIVETIDANHIQMTKFENQRSEGYRAIHGALKGYVQSLRQTAKVYTKTEESRMYRYLQRFYCADYRDQLIKTPEHHDGTCSWLLELEAFEAWSNGTGPGICWLHGYPGFGKSVLAKYVVESFTKRGVGCALPNPVSSPPTVVYFFCFDQDESRKSTCFLLRSTIHQILTKHKHLVLLLESSYPEIDKWLLDSEHELWKALSLLVSALESLVIVVDAVDELEERMQIPFLRQVTDLFHSNGEKARVFLTSRTEPAIEKYFCTLEVTDIRLDDCEANKTDVLTFVEDVVGEYASENSFDKGSTGKIIAELSERANGMFLWAKLAWEHFQADVEVWSSAALRHKLHDLQQLPPGMDGLYHRLLSKVATAQRRELLHILRWLVVARRPLSVDELSEALAMQDGPLTHSSVEPRWNIPQYLKRICPHTIRVDSDNIISLVHQSFKDFLLNITDVVLSDTTTINRFHIDYLHANVQAARGCLNYIALEDTELGLKRVISDSFEMDQQHVFLRISRRTLNAFPFLNYSRSHWSSHLSFAEDDDQAWTAISRIIKNESNYRVLHVECDGYQVRIEPPLFLMYRKEYFLLMQKLIDAGEDLNDASWTGYHIMHIIGMSVDDEGKIPGIEFLVGLGADVNGRNSSKETILHRATRNGMESVVRALANFPGIDLNASDHLGLTAIHCAVLLDRPVALRMLDTLLACAGLNVNALDDRGRTALTLASAWGKAAAIRRLLDHPQTVVDEGQIDEESLLTSSAIQNWQEMILHLLERLEDIDRFTDAHGRNILHLAVKYAMTESLQVALVKQHNGVNQPDRSGLTPLHYAAKEGDVTATKLLLQHGSDPLVQCNAGMMPAHLAATRGSGETVKLLVDGLDSKLINTKDKSGWTITHRATTSGNVGLVRYLVHHPAIDLSVVDSHGRTPLAFVAAYASAEMLDVVLQSNKPKGRMTDAFGNTLLHLAARGNNISTVSLLLRQGGDGLVDVHALNKRGHTALDVAEMPSMVFTTLARAGIARTRSIPTQINIPERPAEKGRRINTESMSLVWMPSSDVDFNDIINDNSYQELGALELASTLQQVWQVQTVAFDTYTSLGLAHQYDPPNRILLLHDFIPEARGIYERLQRSQYGDMSQDEDEDIALSHKDSFDFSDRDSLQDMGDFAYPRKKAEARYVREMKALFSERLESFRSLEERVTEDCGCKYCYSRY